MLIVDEDRHVRAFVRPLLERAGYVCPTTEKRVIQRAAA
jgi:DNA-binding response OmpR family regulator